MTIKSETRLFPSLLSNRQYFGAISTLLYNWPIFAGLLFFGLVTLMAGGFLLPAPWHWLSLISGIGALALIVSILTTSYVVYDWGDKHEYDLLAELGNVAQANVVIDVTCGKLRGTRGLLPHHRNGHYFLIDIYDADKMVDAALRRARAMEPPLQVDRRIYQRPGKPSHLPLPHSWADVIYCDFSLHEVQDAADREALFVEFARVLKPNGRLLIAEHGYDWLNLATFGPGVFSFFPVSTWTQHIANAGLTIQHHQRWRGLVHLWVVASKPR
jgi:ubiquinone/menaquinone biosynthesis C-methylase UbiE